MSILASTASVNTANSISKCVYCSPKPLHVPPLCLHIAPSLLICHGESCVGWGKAWMLRQTNAMVICSGTLWYHTKQRGPPLPESELDTQKKSQPRPARVARVEVPKVTLVKNPCSVICNLKHISIPFSCTNNVVAYCYCPLMHSAVFKLLKLYLQWMLEFFATVETQHILSPLKLIWIIC